MNVIQPRGKWEQGLRLREGSDQGDEDDRPEGGSHKGTIQDAQCTSHKVGKNWELDKLQLSLHSATLIDAQAANDTKRGRSPIVI